MRKPTRPTRIEQLKVCCADCRHGTRDTEGASFNITTKEFFMGLCEQGVADGTTIYTEDGRARGRVFMDNPRVCGKFTKRQA